VDIDELLEPGGLFKSALFGTLLRDHVDIAQLAAGTRVGPYAIEQPLGQGGMGVVYLAARVDGQFEQHVAIKFLARRVVAPNLHDDFRRERQIVAALNHAHIAHLLDGGVLEDGRLWFAVEHVDGAPIDAYCAKNDLSLRERVLLLLPVITAVQYAHSRLLVHRDIKPANVCVDDERGAKLLDFGVATFTDEEDAASAYTPAFASPEQRAGERVGTASDIWQLGNLLRIVLAAHSDGSRAPAIPYDLQAVAAKACAQHAGDRYATAQALHDDLLRFLAREPVRARPMTLRYRSTRFLQRHPLAIAASSLALASMLAVVVIGWRLGTAQSVARSEREIANAVTHFVTDDLAAEANPYSGSSHSTVDLGNVLSKASDRAVVTFANHPRLASQVDLGLATALENIQRLDDATKIVARALVRLDPADPQNFELINWLKALNAELVLDLQHNEEGRKAIGTIYPDVLKRLGATSPLALHMQTLVGITYHNEQRPTECAQVLRPVLSHLQELRATDALMATSAMTHCAMWLGQFDEALEMAQGQVRTNTALYGAADPRTLVARDVLVSVANASGKFEQALDEGRSMLSQARTTLGSNDEIMGGMLAETGVAASCAGQYDEAIRDLDEAKELNIKVMGPTNIVIAKNLSNQALTFVHKGDLAAAEHAFTQVETILGNHPEDTIDRVLLLSRRGELRLIQGRYQVAADDFGAALDIARKTKIDGTPRSAPAKLGLSIALAHLQRGKEGLALIDEALQVIGNRATCSPQIVAAARGVLASGGNAADHSMATKKE